MMKPVANKTKACFKIGHVYEYIGDEDDNDGNRSPDGSFEVQKLKICNSTWCKKGENICDRTVAIDENGNEWCGIYKDFEDWC